MKNHILASSKKIIASLLVAATVVTSIPGSNYVYANENESNISYDAEISNERKVSLVSDETSDFVEAQDVNAFESIIEENGEVADEPTDSLDENSSIDNEEETEVVGEEETLSEEQLAALIREYDSIVESIDDSRFIFEEGGFEIFEESEEYINLQKLDGVADASEALKQQLMTSIKDAFYSHQSIINLPANTYTYSECSNAFYKVKNAYPEFFYIALAQIEHEYISTAEVSGFFASSIKLKYDTSYDLDTYNYAISKAMSLIDDNMSDLEKALILHEFITNNTAYNQFVVDNGYADDDDVFSPYGVLVKQDAVCQGYALTYQLLLERAGVDVAYVSSRELNHAWNYVKIDGEYYNVDTTWDDPVPNKEGRSYHTYFLVSDSAMQVGTRVKHACNDRVISHNGEVVTYVEANNTQYDTYYWSNIYTPLAYINGYWYYIDSTNKALYRIDVYGNNKSVTYNKFGTWYVFGNKYSAYSKAFSGLFRLGNKLYINKYDGIYSINFDGTGEEKVYAVNTSEYYAYGCSSRFDFKNRNEIAFILLETDPNNKSKVFQISINDLGYQQDKFIVTYVGLEGEKLKEVYVNRGESVTAPVAPDVVGYTFNGWDGNSDNVTTDLVIHAQYTPIEYRINYHLNGGTNPLDAPLTYNIEDGIPSLPIPTKNAYVFGGWYLESDFAGIKYTALSKGQTGDIDLYAKWDDLIPKAPIISIIGSYISYSQNSQFSYYMIDAGTNIKIAEADGYTDVDIFYTLDGSTPSRSNGIKYTGLFTTSSPTTVVKAKAFRGDNGGDVASAEFRFTNNNIVLANDNISLNVSESFTINVVSLPTLRKNTDLTWTVEDGTIASVNRDGVVKGLKAGKTTVTASTTDWQNRPVKASCEVTVVNVTKNVKFLGWGDSLLKEEEVSVNGSATAPTIVPANDGYIFEKWDVSFSKVTTDLVVRAVFKPIDYTITYNYNGGTTVSWAQKSYNIETDSFLLTTSSTKAGYKFGGWYTNSTFSGSAIEEISKGSTGNKQLYAKWIANKPYRPSVNTGSGESISYDGKYVIDAGTMVTISKSSLDTDALNIYYSLDGSDPKGKNVYTSPIQINSDTTIKAVVCRDDVYSEIVSQDFVIADNELSIDKNELLLTVGDESLIQVLKVPTTKNISNVTWKSSDTNIATVSASGSVQALKAGTVDIIASIKDWKGRTITAKCILTVKPYVNDSMVEFTEDFSLISDGEYLVDNTSSISLSVVGDDENAIVYYTTDGTNPNNNSIAYTGAFSLENDTVIKAVTYSKGVKGEVSTRAYKVVNCDLEFEVPDVELKTGEVFDLSLIKIPYSKSIEDVNWSISNDNIATVDGGALTAKNEGSVTVTASVKDWRGQDKTYSCDIAIVARLYNVNFIGFDGNVISSIQMKKGYISHSKLPKIPSQINGYEFFAWSGLFDEIVDDTDIIAVYNPMDNDIFYDLKGGGEFNSEPVNTYTCESDDIVLAHPEAKEGNRFAGWYDNEEYTGSPINYIPKGSWGTKVFYAKWVNEKELYIIWKGYSYGESPELVYTGKALKPEFEVYYGDSKLDAGKDYTFAYKNNVNVNVLNSDKKRNYVEIKGKGNYSGVVSGDFVIKPKSIEDVDIPESRAIDIDVTSISVNYNGKIQKIRPVVTFNGKSLSSKDYIVEYISTEENAYKNPGEYEILIKGIGNYSGTISSLIKINATEDKKIPMSKCKATIKGFTCTGNALAEDDILKQLSVANGRNPLSYGDDYTIRFGTDYNGVECKEIGTYTVVIIGNGDYIGELRAKLNITGINIKDVNIGNIEPISYSGIERCPGPIVTATDGTQLIYGTHFTVSYKNNINVGTAKVIITGKGLYTGTKSKDFKIVKPLVDENTLDINFVDGTKEIPYEKGGVKPKLNVSYMGTSLVEGKDFTVAYKNANAITTDATVNKPYAVITTKKNLSGVVQVPFTIVESDISKLNISVTDIVENAKAGKYISNPVITDKNGKKLVKNVDYDSNIIYKSKGSELNKDSKPVAGDVIEVTVQGKNGYTNSISATYRVYAKGKSVASASIKLNKELVYNGQPITITKDDLVVTVNKKPLLSEDYDIVENSYFNNVNKGTAKVTIVGKGEYAGMKQISFTIKPQKMKWWENISSYFFGGFEG